MDDAQYSLLGRLQHSIEDLFHCDTSKPRDMVAYMELFSGPLFSIGSAILVCLQFLKLIWLGE